MIVLCSVLVSLDRGRARFDEGEKELMSEVRRLRSKLALDSRNRKPPTTSSSDSVIG